MGVEEEEHEMRAERESMSIDRSDIAEPTADAAWSDPDVTAHVEVAPDSRDGADPYSAKADGITAFEETEASNPV